MEEGRVRVDPQACARFWALVKEGEDALARLEPIAAMERLNEWLQPLMPELAVEISGSSSGEPQRRELVVTAHGSIPRFEAVQVLAAAAPNLRWFEVIPFRRRSDNDFGMRMDGFELKTSEVIVRHRGEAGQVDLELSFAREIPMDRRDHAQHMAFIMLDHILGEYDFAIKVGAVDFPEDEPAVPGVGLHEFAAVFDAFWTGELAHSGDFPQGEHGWTGLKVTRRVDGDEILVMRNDSAGALVGRADLSYRLEIGLPVPTSAELDIARLLEDRLSGALEARQEGVCSHVVLQDRVRHMHWYVADEPAALSAANALVSELKLTDAQVASDYDPAWAEYLQWVD